MRNGGSETSRQGFAENTKKSTNEASILLKAQEAKRNEAKKYLKAKELFDTSGVKAKKYLKSNEISFLKVTNLVVLRARKDANSPQNKQKCPVKAKTKRSFRGVGENDNKSATSAPDVHRSPACPEVYIRPRDCTIRSCGDLTSSREFC